jgi:hypothetical protein
LNYESKVELDVLPEGVDFAGSLGARIHYDGRAKQLILIGVMSEEERKELLSLVKDDSYTAAVHALFELSQHVPVREDRFLCPVSRALARPRVGNGATVQGDTRWEPWFEQVTFRKQMRPTPIGMQVTVDTSAAGFTEPPCYFAWLEGTLWDKSNVEFFPVPFTHIDRKSIDSFRLRLWLPPLITLLGTRLRLANSNFIEEFINYARQREHGLHVCWIGIQEGRVVDHECAATPQVECQTTSED